GSGIAQAPHRLPLTLRERGGAIGRDERSLSSRDGARSRYLSPRSMRGVFEHERSNRRPGARFRWPRAQVRWKDLVGRSRTMERTRSSRAMVVGMLALGGLAVPGSVRAEEPQAIDDVPRGTYVRVDDPDALADHGDAQHGGAPHILFLQRCEGGLTISPGNGGSIANQSQIVEGVINFPPFPYGDSAWNDVVERTR